MRARAALAAVLAAAAAGCGGGGEPPAGAPPPPEPPSGTAYFTGRGPEGLGAAVDLMGNDAGSRAVAAALTPDPLRGTAPVVAIASLVNDSDTPVRVPSFVAVLASGGAAPMTPARAALAGRRDATARRALAALPRPRRAVPAGGAAVVHLVLRGAGAREVREVRMAVSPGRPATLAARER